MFLWVTVFLLLSLIGNGARHHILTGNYIYHLFRQKKRLYDTVYCDLQQKKVNFILWYEAVVLLLQ
jgi:predicted AAA+ superfamily ATPase